MQGDESVIETPESRTILYSCDGDGNVQSYRFLEESIAEGASVPTWVLLDQSVIPYRRVRTSRSVRFRRTTREAFKDHVQMLERSVAYQKQALSDAKRNLAEGRAKLKEAKATLAKMTTKRVH